MRVGFTLIGGKNWTGGYNYLLNLVRVLATELPGQIEPFLFAGTDVSVEELEPFAAITGCTVVQDAAFNESRRLRSILGAVVLGRDRAVKQLFSCHRVDVVFEAAMFFGWRLGMPVIAWMPDFQHRCFPRLFGRKAFWKRELGFRAQIASGRTVMVSSEDSRKVCENLYSSTHGRVHAVRFAVEAPPARNDADAFDVARRYGLPDQYLFMPNQFWAHKNHRVVVHALQLLRTRGKRWTVMAPGKQNDPRDPLHVPALLDEVRTTGLSEQFRMPGLIPYSDLALLMQASVALLNPSLFEGWSTTVEEARSVGVPMILSDLDVHREQAGDDAAYFERNSAESLASAVEQFVVPDRLQRAVTREKARLDAKSRVRRFATDFLSLVKTVHTSSRYRGDQR